MKSLSKKALPFLLGAAFIFSFASCSKEKTSSDKVLNVMTEVEVESLDPQEATDGTSFEVIANFTDGLKQMASDGSTINALCESETVSEDGLTYTFKIRDDAFWSNGDPVTADDFVFGWQRAADPKVASEYSYMLSDIGQIKNSFDVIAGKLPVEELGVKALDDKTLQVELIVPVSYFDSILYFPTFYPVNRKFYESVGERFATSADTVLSNGAFILTDYQPAAVSFTFKKNENYYNAANVKLEGLNYQVLKDSQQALMAYQNGTLDVIKLSGDQVEQVQDDAEFRTIGAGYLWYISPMMQNVPELQNLNFRKAISFAIDRESIVKNVLKDGSMASYTPVPAEFAYNQDGEDFITSQKEFPELCDSDSVKALEFYNQAKRELGKDSFEFEMILDDPTIQQNVAAVIKEQIEKTLPGFTLNLRVEPKKQRVQDMQDGNFEIALTRWGPDYADPMTYLGMWITNNSNNYGLWSNATYDALIASCVTGEYAQKPAERWATMKEAEKIVLENAVIFPLYQQAEAYMIKSNVSGIDFHPVALNRVYKNASK